MKTILTNFGCGQERFTDIYRTYEYNLSKTRDEKRAEVSMEVDIIKHIEDELMKEGQ